MITLAFYRGHGGSYRDRVVDATIRTATGSIYSHVELIPSIATLDASAYCLSSSPRDGGVRGKQIHLRADHWDLQTVRADPDEVRRRIGRHAHCPYDLCGAILTPWRLSRPLSGSSRWFCSELVAHGLGIYRPWTYAPGHLYDLVTVDGAISEVP